MDNLTTDESSVRKSGTEDSLLFPQAHRKGRAERMWKPIKLHLTEKYHYIPRSLIMKLGRYAMTWAVLPAIYLVMWVRWGFSIEGRENLRAVRGRTAITVSNHIHDMDSIMITAPMWPNTPYIVARKHNLEVFLLGIVNRLIGAVPLPEDLSNLQHFRQAMQKYLTGARGRLHIFPEGEIMPYAHKLRTFRNGAFRMAIDSNAPIVPMVLISTAPERVRLRVGEVIELRDVPGLNDEGLTAARRTRILNEYTKQRMQAMLDEYYGEANGENSDGSHTGSGSWNPVPAGHEGTAEGNAADRR